MMLGGTLPVPLYVLYEKQMGFGPLGVTVVFAAYVAGHAGRAGALGDLSDHIGRRKVLAIAVACAAVSTALFLAASGIGLLIVARVVSGTGRGIRHRDRHRRAGRAPAARRSPGRRGGRLREQHDRAGLGPLVAACSPSTWRCRPAACSGPTWAVRAGAGRARGHPRDGPHLTAGQPPAADRPFRPACGPSCSGACLGVFAAFSVLGLFSSLVPTFLHGMLGVHNLALIGGASFLIFIIAAISQAVSARLPSRRSVSAGLPLLLVCLAALEAALFAKALWLFLVATIAGGIAVGFIFRGGLSELNRLAEPRHRAAVVSTFFVAAYLGLGLPAVLIGLISLAVGPVDASAYVSGLAAAIVVVAFIMVLRTFGTVPAPKPPCTPIDGWCGPEEPAVRVRERARR